MNVLELFAGSRSIGKVAESRGHKVFSSDIIPFPNIDYPVDILDFQIQAVPFIPEIVWCSPPCTTFSVASMSKHWHIDNRPKTKEAEVGVAIVKKTIEIIEIYKKINPNLIWYIENPRGKLRKLPFTTLSMAKGIDRATVTYCSYGDKRMKPTDIWTNNLNSLLNPWATWKPKALCFNGNDKCHHNPAPRGASSGTQGIKGNYERSKIPVELCEEIIFVSEQKLLL